MLDLNLNDEVSTSESTRNESSVAILEELPGAPPGAQMDESGTSNSSIVNADGCDDEPCSARAAAADVRTFTFSFGILKAGEGGAGVADDEVGATRQLFPVREVGADMERCSESSAMDNRNGVFAVDTCTDKEGPRLAMPQQRRKSRRGPRSRSSQYRGVTFYRRTGRWESHIWLVDDQFDFSKIRCICSYLLKFLRLCLIFYPISRGLMCSAAWFGLV